MLLWRVDWLVQVDPPFVVPTIIESSEVVSPIVSHTDVDGQERFVIAPIGVWVVQVAPPLVVPIMELTAGKSY